MHRYSGVVIHGDGEGRRLGFPTANIQVEQRLSGIWAGTVTIDRHTYPSALFASVRRPILEAHILDFDGDLYGRHISVEIVQSIREDRAFSSIEDLRQQIVNDVQSVREYFRMPKCSPES
jgi:riboflavin kinase/FMN adenylyltransferase